MWWNRITEWFSEYGERKKVLNEFNRSAKDTSVSGLVPVFLKAETSIGNNSYRHQFSNFFFHVFKIKTLTGRGLTNDEIIALGSIIVSNSSLTRKLVTLGFDTLEITDTNGNINIAGLFIDKEYTLKEIQTPSNYILNNDKIKFKVTIDDQGNPQVNIISGTLRNNANITNEEGIYTLNLEVEDIAKYDVKIVKSSVAGEKLKGIKFRLTGGIYGDNGRIFTTNSNGEVSMINLIPDTEYKLQETRADGYYVNQNISTFTISRNFYLLLRN